MDENTTLIVLKVITKFVRDLAEGFPQNKGVQLYNRLIEKTTIAHDKPVAKHVETFQKFCVVNAEGILSMDFEAHPTDVNDVAYSDKVAFDIKQIVRAADADSRAIIFKHLLTILAFVSPQNAQRAKAVLRGGNADGASSSVPAVPTDTNEGKFLTDIISSVEKSIDPTQITNPVQAIQSVLSTGVFTDMLGKMHEGMSSGQLDLGKLMGTMTSMLGGTGAPAAGGADPMASMMSMLGPMLNGMGGGMPRSSQ